MRFRNNFCIEQKHKVDVGQKFNYTDQRTKIILIVEVLTLFQIQTYAELAIRVLCYPSNYVRLYDRLAHTFGPCAYA